MADDTKIKDQNPNDQSTNTQGGDDLNLNFDDLDISAEPKAATEKKPAAEVETKVENTEVQTTKGEQKVDLSKLGADIPSSEEVKINDIPDKPVAEEIPTEPVVEKTPSETVVVEETKTESVAEESKTEPVVEKTPAEPVVAEAKTDSTTPSSGDARLDKEDKIVEQTEEEKKATTEESPEKVGETKDTEISKDKDATSFDIKKTSLEEDQKIIDDLTSTTKDEETTKTEDQKVDGGKEVIQVPQTSAEQGGVEVVEDKVPITETPKVEQETPTVGSSFNLDSIIASHTEPTNPVPVETQVTEQLPTTEVQATVQTPEIQTQTPMPGAGVQTAITTPPIANTETNTVIQTQQIKTKKSHRGKKMITLFLFIVLGGASAYVLKTMYPLEYESLKVNVLSIIGQTEESSDQGLEELLTATGDLQTETGDMQVETGDLIFETGNIQPETGELETDFDAFEDLDAILTGMDPDPVQSKDTLSQLKEFADQANTFLELGKKINDKVMIKYSVYIERKATELIQSIENGEEIDNKKVESYLAQFSGYLQQLTTLSYDSSDTPQEQTPIVQTGGDIVPEETENDMIQDIDWETDTDQSGDNETIPEIQGV